MDNSQPPIDQSCETELDRGEAALIDAIQAGDESAWRQLIDQYEGRLLAYVQRRLQDRSVSEDIVQETLVGFLVSLPNYDRRRRLENYLFSICGYKLTDHLRRTGRRPTLPLYGRGESQASSSSELQIPGRNRAASSIARSAERLELEKKVVAGAIRDQITRWSDSGNYTKMQALELIFVAGRGNIEVAEQLGLSQQQVANLKSDFLTRMKAIISRQDLDPGVFPELAEGS
ncbi:RNA polymerase sigma factor [Rhodopirellula sallentina]|uniref:RNA polymerase ECF-type sigma factor n=1 Tax=Rhodopirellula sallentina SM41 TaxID=1263870 RepID=M5U6Q5_9BACT|nr:sigma-70 family RNA polymerase sigma factor [Rhodopirellula sallentina]EMI53556.1 RNA polymerase ECF-type sigma factor [Rhodopirellula sallentina SM41]